MPYSSPTLSACTSCTCRNVGLFITPIEFCVQSKEQTYHNQAQLYLPVHHVHVHTPRNVGFFESLRLSEFCGGLLIWCPCHPLHRYLDRIIRLSELEEFSALLSPHQKATTADGTCTVTRVVSCPDLFTPAYMWLSEFKLLGLASIEILILIARKLNIV